jgi:hypothetical protein
MHSLKVTVIGHNAGTVEALRRYLDGAGATSSASRTLAATRTITGSTAAVIVFPDEFAAQDVVASVLALRTAHPSVLVMLVTSVPQSFAAAMASDGRSVPPLTLPKPAFGWTIVDVIRAHVEARESGDPEEQ